MSVNKKINIRDVKTRQQTRDLKRATDARRSKEGLVELMMRRSMHAIDDCCRPKLNAYIKKGDWKNGFESKEDLFSPFE